jgi:hypothetical protein
MLTATRPALDQRYIRQSENPIPAWLARAGAMRSIDLAFPKRASYLHKRPMPEYQATFLNMQSIELPK